jgi:hypothetical protein
MVTIKLDGDALDIQVQGMHKLWALRSSLRVPLADVRDVRHDPERARRVMPGAIGGSRPDRLRGQATGGCVPARRPGVCRSLPAVAQPNPGILTPSMSLLPGLRLGPYEVLGRLGEGPSTCGRTS